MMKRKLLSLLLAALACVACAAGGARAQQTGAARPSPPPEVVTLALALLTFFITHIEGIRANGSVRYFKSWIPEVPKALLPLIIPLEILGQFMRLISLSVRLFANMLAGHILILTFIGLMFILETIILFPLVIVVGSAFYIFEVAIVVSIQAFIFAALSAIYIGSAIEPEH